VSDKKEEVRRVKNDGNRGESYLIVLKSDSLDWLHGYIGKQINAEAQRAQRNAELERSNQTKSRQIKVGG
jgi:hypothetical protein